MKTPRLRLAGALIGLGAVGLGTFQTTNAAFNASTDNSSNSFATGSVTLVDDDSATAMFAVSNMVPNDTYSKCIEVNYTGSSFDLTAVKLYGALGTNDSNIADHLDLKVEVGSGAGFGDCTGFTAASTLFATAPLSSFTTSHSSFANGLAAYTPASGSTARTFKFTVTLGADTPNTAQGKTATANFTWEVQSA